MILALALAFALAVPAFAYDKKAFTLEEVDFSVAPIGVATIKGETEWGGEVSYENVYVFDQDCVASLKDGRGFECCGFDEIIRGIGDSEWPEDGELFQVFQFYGNSSGVYWFGFNGQVEDESGYPYVIINAEACYMTTKAYLDALTAAGFTVTFTPLEQPSQPSKPATPANKPAPGVSVPLNDGSGEFMYTIKYGDTLGKIAAYYYYNDMSVYKLIYERNKDVLKDANTIYAGQVITLPSYAAVSEFRAAAQKPAQPEQKPAEPEEPAESEQPSAEAVTYTVKAGDSLSRIAKAFYGDATQWKVIYEANKDAISNPNSIRVGQVLAIPAK